MIWIGFPKIAGNGEKYHEWYCLNKLTNVFERLEHLTIQYLRTPAKLFAPFRMLFC